MEKTSALRDSAATLSERGAAPLSLAIYGKGGIGKSTVTANLAAAFSRMGLRVVQIGCDPKADSTINLLHGEKIPSVMDVLRGGMDSPQLSDIAHIGFGGVVCVEAGGPTPGLGCAGRGIIATFKALEEAHLAEEVRPDVVLYDVLGDVVCGGFAAPLREGYAREVIIVTSGEKMALYAAGNIACAVRNFEDRDYASLRGVVLNRRNVANEEEKVAAFAQEQGVPVIASIPRSDEITECEDRGMTVIEGAPDSEAAKRFMALAQQLRQSGYAASDGRR